jgi:raffinose/stachyose/melibiose transport system permease protein
MKKRHNARLAILYIILSVYAVASLYPFIWMVLNSFKSTQEIFVFNPFGLPRAWMLTNFVDVFKNFRFDIYFKNSLFVAIGTVALTCLFALMFAYGVCRMQWKLSKLVNTYLLTGLMIPLGVVIIPLMITVRSLHLIDSPLGLIVTYTAFNVAFASTVFFAFLRTLPSELEDAACIDGASIYRTFLSIIVPMVKPAIATVAIFVFLNSWNEFTLALILINHQPSMTLPMGLFTFFGEHGGTDWGGLSATLTLTCLPVILIYLFFSETIEKALTVGAVSK